MVKVHASGKPASADSLARDAELLAARGKLAAAQSAAAAALAIAPGNPLALRVAGSLARRTGHHELAEGYLRRAVELGAGEPQAQRELAACLADQGEVARAIALFPSPSPRDAEAWFELGVLHDRNADGPPALEAAERVERLQPGHGGAQLLIARALTALGRIDEAAARYRKLTHWPALAARAWFGLLDLKTVAITADELRTLERLANRQGVGDDDRKLAGYALGQAYEMAGRPADAVRAFDLANRQSRRETGWDAALFSHAVDVNLEAFPHPGAENSSTGSGLGTQAIFILGMPRSGTTLVEHVLAAHSQVVGASELPDIGLILAAESIRRGQPFPLWVDAATTADWQRLGEEYLARTERWQGRARFTDKMPENWLYLGAILRMLPGARVIRCAREPLETAWSCYKQLFAPGRFGWSYDYESLAAYTVDERRQWQHFERQQPRRCYGLAHEALVTDLEGQVRALLAFVGLDYEPGCLDFTAVRTETRTASAAQVRQPLDRATARRTAYGRALDPLAQALARAEARSPAPGVPARAI